APRCAGVLLMAGAMLVVGSMLVSATLTVGLAATGGAAVAARRAAGAADNAAIAAADTVSGALPGEPCARAAEVAEASGARLVSCDTEDLDAIVSVRVSFAGMAAVARARAGPPRDSGVPE
ncbi:Rv3654c family TadE-like protein, partial [Microbacterium sp. C448]|uniref:Rv3654c family TadE-like protein n=2 Tax=unclassified Microbacterium TaxID=2609290 RepID=UPI00278BE4CF